MRQDPTSKTGRRQDRLIRERVHDPYKTRLKLPEPTVCPQCKAAFHKGRWCWEAPVTEKVHEELCQACHRINDRFPAGWVTISGSFARTRRSEVVQLSKHQEALENKDHPLHRIMAIEETEERVVITTTDIHLPRRIGDALHHAYRGELTYHYDEEAYCLRVDWRRDD